MKKLLILSDSHRLTKPLQEIKDRHMADYYIHCGDSQLSYDHPKLQGYTIVEGNCDSPGQFPLEEQLYLDPFRILITHGHLYQVKRHLLPLSYRAEEVDAQIICFGHSHLAGAEKIDGRLYINPGSIRTPRGRKEKTYALLSWEDASSLEINFYTIDGELVTDLSTSVTF